jgi:type IV pilus assembly protein PilP
MPPNKPKGSLFLALAFCFLASGADASQEEGVYKSTLPPKPAELQPPAATATSSTGEAQAYAYDPAGKTDPFKSFILEQEEMAEKVQRKPRTYLETLDLSQLELIAIITGPQGNYAMVRDSKGVGHVIVKGTAVGNNGGVVDKITDREVLIREEYLDFRGTTQFKDVSKKLPSLM